jgi:hypothetical protein
MKDFEVYNSPSRDHFEIGAPSASVQIITRPLSSLFGEQNVLNKFCHQ